MPWWGQGLNVISSLSSRISIEAFVKEHFCSSTIDKMGIQFQHPQKLAQKKWRYKAHTWIATSNHKDSSCLGNVHVDESFHSFIFLIPIKHYGICSVPIVPISIISISQHMTLLPRFRSFSLPFPLLSCSFFLWCHPILQIYFILASFKF